MPTTSLELVDESRSLNGVLTASRPITVDGWQVGLDIEFGGCSPVTVEDRCLKQLEADGLTVAHFDPFLIAAGATCAPMSGADLERRATERLNRNVEYGLARALVTGEGTDNPSLADATSVGGFGDVTSAVACLLGTGAQVGFGMRLTLLLSLAGATHAAAAGIIQADQGRWVTPSGADVVVSPGVPDPPCGEPLTAYVTGPLFTALDPVFVTTGRDHRLNAIEVYAERLAIAVFDPCLNLSATFEPCTPCEATSP